jgi:hypothetical protein
MLVNHPKTMGYVHEVVKEKPSINNSEIRCRYRGNQSGSHGSGPHVSRKYEYKYEPQAGIDCGMVRMVYFVRDNSNEEGAFCVVPGCACGQPRSTSPPCHPPVTSDGACGVSCLAACAHSTQGQPPPAAGLHSGQCR